MAEATLRRLLDIYVEHPLWLAEDRRELDHETNVVAIDQLLELRDPFVRDEVELDELGVVVSRRGCTIGEPLVSSLNAPVAYVALAT